MGQEQPIEVAVWSDVVCPFCNVARERAEWLRERGLTVVFLPFDLHPEYPDEGIPRDDLMRRYPAAMHDTVKRLNEEAGLAYNPHPDRVPRTRRALELIEWSRSHGLDTHQELHDRVMDAYWTEGRDIMDWDVLLACVADVGLDPGEARAEVESGVWAREVDASTSTAQRHGIRAVPAFVFDGRLLVSGAQPHEVFEAAIEKVGEMRAEEAASRP
jgi:predicted DsbA family dithiol-disulfide isomerase